MDLCQLRDVRTAVSRGTNIVVGTSKDDPGATFVTSVLLPID